MAPINPNTKSDKETKSDDLTTGFKRPRFRISKPMRPVDKVAILEERLGQVSVVEKKKEPNFLERILRGGIPEYSKLKSVMSSVQTLNPFSYVQYPPVRMTKELGDGMILPDWSAVKVSSAQPTMDNLGGLFSSAMNSVTNPYLYDTSLTVTAGAQRFLAFLNALKAECDMWVYTWNREQLVSAVKFKASFKASVTKSQQELEWFQMLLLSGRVGWDFGDLDGDFFGTILPTLEAIDRLTTKMMDQDCDYGGLIRNSLSFPTINVCEEVKRRQGEGARSWTSVIKAPKAALAMFCRR